MNENQGEFPCRKCGVFFIPNKNQLKKKDFSCKPCLKEYHRKYRENNPAFLERVRKWNMRPDIAKKRHDYWKKKFADPLYAAKHNARKKLFYAIKAGKVQRLPCEICGNKKVDGHHDDYKKALDVRWMCRTHHIRMHFDGR